MQKYYVLRGTKVECLMGVAKEKYPIGLIRYYWLTLNGFATGRLKNSNQQASVSGSCKVKTAAKQKSGQCTHADNPVKHK